MGEEKKRSKKKKTKLPVILAAVAGIVAIFLIVAFFSPLFAIRRIEVAELKNYTQEEIAAYLQEYVGKNGLRTVIGNSSLHQSKSIFSMELPKAEEKLTFACPYLENVRVKFSFDGTLRVEADERKPAFLTEYYDTYLLCDTHGIVLETFTGEDVPDGMPLVTGITPDGYKLGKSISDGKNKNIDTAIKLCSLMSQLDMNGYIDIADVSDYNNIYMYCAPSLTIKLGGTEDMGVKLSLLKGTMEKGVDGYSNATLTVADGRQATLLKNGERED